MGRATFTAKVEGSAATRFLRGSRAVRGILQRQVRGDLLQRLVRVSRQAAPEAGGHLSRGLRGIPSGSLNAEVISTVRSPRGYNYTGVTRFGHRKRWITPKRKKALAFQIGGKTIIRRRVRGYRPSHDWADDAMRLAGPHVQRAATQMGRELQAAIG